MSKKLYKDEERAIDKPCGVCGKDGYICYFRKYDLFLCSKCEREFEESERKKLNEHY